ncbi:hypothetical protein WKT02_10970 [Erysipelotrichaceae bacterium HCN-30851]
MQGLLLFVLVGGGMFLIIGIILYASHSYNLDGIKAKTVGNGQHGTARFGTEKEIRNTYHLVSYEPKNWRRGKHLPDIQGLVVGCNGSTES